MKVICVSQVDGRRYLALSDHDARRVSRDPAMLDYVVAEACLDVDQYGCARWEWPFGCQNTPEGKAAIREHRGEQQRVRIAGGAK